jgi:pseudaminic acid synthase
MKFLHKNKTYIIAEMSANHNGDLQRAINIIHAAKESGADAIKLQTYTADTLTTDCDNEFFKIKGGTLWDGRSLYELYKEAYTPWEWHQQLKKIADEVEIDFFSTPFDSTAVDFLEDMEIKLYKVASFELIDIPLLEKIASTQKPVIMSTGMATLAEIDEAVRTLRNNGCPEVALLKCVSSYPANPEDMNLRTIPHLAKAFNCITGVSDHSMELAVPVVAVTLGAKIIEKHFTLSRKDKGPDSEFSLEPHEFRLMVDAVRTAEKALGTVSYELTASEHKSKVFRRSLFVVKAIKQGELFTNENVRSIRPGYGLHPRYSKEIIGTHASRDIQQGTPLEVHHYNF